MEKVPCAFNVKESLKELRGIVSQNNGSYSILQKCEKMGNVVRETFHQPQRPLSFITKLTIFNILNRILVKLFTLNPPYDIISEIEDISLQISYISTEIDGLIDSMHSEQFPSDIATVFEEACLGISVNFSSVKIELLQRIDFLASHHVLINHHPIILENEESLTKCPGLKDKLASSSKTLLDAAADVICSVCLFTDLSSQEDFAILDKCAHLFCKDCTKRWFEVA